MTTALADGFRRLIRSLTIHEQSNKFHGAEKLQCARSVPASPASRIPRKKWENSKVTIWLSSSSAKSSRNQPLYLIPWAFPFPSIPQNYSSPTSFMDIAVRNYWYDAVPCARLLKPSEIRNNYEANAGEVIVVTFSK
jgi:hypothetical protein